MATEKQIREAIASTIQTAAPLSVVIPRNIVGKREDDGWLGSLQSPADSNRIRGWTVTLVGRKLIEDRLRAAEYELVFDVWQYLQYWMGNNTDNSEDVLSAEQEAVIIAFADELPGPLEWATPIEFSLIDKFTIGTRDVHIGQGTITIRTAVNCP